MTRHLKVGAQVVAIAAVAGLLALLVWKLTHQQGSGIGPRVDEGKMPAAPAFTLPRLDGRGDFALASLKGKVVVVNFWATWCDPCVREAPVLAEAHRDWRDDGVVFVGVDVKDVSADARRFVRKYELAYPHVRDRQAKTAAKFGAFLYPETFFIARDGKVVLRIKGALERDELDRSIRRALRA